MNKAQYKHLRELQNNGIDVQKTSNVKPNAGSETWKHFLAKSAVAYLGQINGYRVDSEVDFDNGRECDILLWGHSSRHTLVIECESGIDAQVLESKYNHYVDDYRAIDDMLMIEVLNVPESSLEALEYISDQIGLQP